MKGLDGPSWARGIDLLAAAFGEAEASLCACDGAIGDGDHGSSMLRGFQEAQAALRDRPAVGAGEVLVRAGQAFVENVGGVRAWCSAPFSARPAGTRPS